ncbi:MAG: LysR family transcriptional regulator [Gammaproteobacteria bacterium]|nr:LysR family transcriptional regulator [Gammaproteobacteria bacterium]MBU1507081.1 LysR family transcriptional regulator [Gammaproteobacteria bacterium]MBU2121717.1 LysR family transcriptional regulator [Gammaproteobacteria bacterium]MBU2172736.1 LysR family transcriptional regulator [Gammaproteobacteria bacterium]MBU2200760.1 LysR family transcriptional regulator [Gammaproteobacteria bacterium]
MATPTLDIDLLRSFAAVAQAGTLGAAAERVGRTQSALSMQMQRLEDACGQTLLHRTGRGVRLTHPGERLLVHARRILHQHDEALADLAGTGLAGALAVGCPDDYAAAFLPHLLRGFAQQHPLARVDVVCASTPRLRERLATRALDVALVSTPWGAAPEPGMLTALRREPLVWVAAPGMQPRDWDPLPLALSDPDVLDHLAAREGLDAQGRRYRVAYASGSLTGLTAVVRAGSAVAVLTRCAVPPDLQVLPPDAGLPELPLLAIGVAFAGRQPTPLATAFAHHVRDVLPSL